MKIYRKIRSTAENIPAIEVNVDTVYIRSNIIRIEEIDFSGWEYDEIQYDKNKYIEQLANEEDSSMMALMVSMLMSEVDMIKSEIQTLKGGVA